MDKQALIASITFYAEEGWKQAPTLRTAAGETVGTDTKRDDFIEAAVACGYNAATAGVCWAAGRKFMMELDKELTA